MTNDKHMNNKLNKYSHGQISEGNIATATVKFKTTPCTNQSLIANNKSTNFTSFVTSNLCINKWYYWLAAMGLVCNYLFHQLKAYSS